MHKYLAMPNIQEVLKENYNSVFNKEEEVVFCFIFHLENWNKWIFCGEKSVFGDNQVNTSATTKL